MTEPTDKSNLSVMANATKPGSGYEIDIESSVCTGQGTYAIQWCFCWPERYHGETRWVSSPSVSTEVRVTVHNRGRFSTSRDVSVDFDVLSDDVPADVRAKLFEYAAEEEQRDYEGSKWLLWSRRAG